MLHALKMLVKSSHKSSHKPHKPFVLDALQCKSFLKLRSATASVDSFMTFSWYYLQRTPPFFFSNKLKATKKANSCSSSALLNLFLFIGCGWDSVLSLFVMV